MEVSQTLERKRAKYTVQDVERWDLPLNSNARDYQTVAVFDRQSTRGADADLKALAMKTLPTLREHQQLVKTLPGNESSSNRMKGNSNRP